MAQPNQTIQYILSTDNPCQLANINIAISRKESLKRINHIIDIMSTGKEEQRLDPNFETKDLTAPKVKRLFRLLNKFFYNGTLLRTIKKNQIRIFWEIFPFNEEPYQACLKTLCVSAIQSKKPVELHFMINTNRFEESAKYRITNGIQVQNKLQALAVSGLHEFTHAIQYTFCPELQGHNSLFGNLNYKLHGSDKEIFEYRDEIPSSSSSSQFLDKSLFHD